MATRESINKLMNDTIDEAIASFNKPIAKIQRELMAEIEGIIRGMDFDGDKIKNTVANIRALSNIQNKLRRIIFSTEYKENVQNYIKSFNEITVIQNQYIRTIVDDFTVSSYLKEIKNQSIQTTIDNLTENGINANIINPISEVLRTNITSGGSYRQMSEQLRDLVTNNGTGKGIMDRYLKGQTIDAINQYNRNYIQAATAGFTSGWFLYSGSLIETSRCFCEAMRSRKYFHEIEIPSLLEGDFEEYKEKECKKYGKTGLPQGMIAGTNSANFLTNLGGYGCGHRALPVPEITVPEDIKEFVYNKYPSVRPKAKPST